MTEGSLRSMPHHVRGRRPCAAQPSPKSILLLVKRYHAYLVVIDLTEQTMVHISETSSESEHRVLACNDPVAVDVQAASSPIHICSPLGRRS